MKITPQAADAFARAWDETRDGPRENMFGKIRGRFDEAAAHDAVNEIIKRFAWGFASLSEADRARAMIEFNTLHNPHHKTGRPKYEVVKHG